MSKEKKLKSIMGTKKVHYPEDDDLWVEMYDDVEVGVASRIEENDIEAVFALLASVVRDWNFADVDGEELEVTEENMKRLPSKIAEWLSEEIRKNAAVGEEAKKN